MISFIPKNYSVTKKLNMEGVTTPVADELKRLEYIYGKDKLVILIHNDTFDLFVYIDETHSDYTASISKESELVKCIPKGMLLYFFEDAIYNKTIQIFRFNNGYVQDKKILVEIPFKIFISSKRIFFELNLIQDNNEEKILKTTKILQSKIESLEEIIKNMNNLLIRSNFEPQFVNNPYGFIYMEEKIPFCVNDFNNFLLKYFPDYKKMYDTLSCPSFEEMNYMLGSKENKEENSVYFDFSEIKDGVIDIINNPRKLFIQFVNKRANVLRTYLSLKGYEFIGKGGGTVNNSGFIKSNRKIYYAEHNEQIIIIDLSNHKDMPINEYLFKFGRPIYKSINLEQNTCLNNELVFSGVEILDYEKW